MTRSHNICLVIILLATVLAGVASPATAAVLTRHATAADFLAALGPPMAVTFENFDRFAKGTVISGQVQGVVFSSPNSGLAGYVPIQAVSLPQVVSHPYALGGGFVDTKTVTQKMDLDFTFPASALGFYLIAQGPVARQVSVNFELADGTTQVVPIIQPGGGSNGNVFFFGITSDTPFPRAGIVSNSESGGLFQQFGGLDDLRFAVADLRPPVCSGNPSEISGILGVDGKGRDDRPGDTGIASVTLDPNSIGLDLSVDPFTPGDPLVAFRVEPLNPLLEARGTIKVADGAANTCSLCLNFKNLPPGPTFDEILCCDEGVRVFINNKESTPPGQSFCSTAPLGPDQPALPSGYEPSLGTDPFPCAVFTIDSPISGPTDVVLKKDGTFDPNLRLMFSRSPDGGLTFPPFTDVTDSVIPILDINPDPTKLGGKTTWSVVKIACAVQAELCNGLDDDGDGLIDEGLPVAGPQVDQDADGFFLCAATPALADCNDQISTINPAATETCNGLDDNCDSAIDEGNPGGGASCTVVGALGVCAQGLTSCIEGALACPQTVQPSPEICDGLDNDCDGVVDNGNPGGGATCGATDVGECSYGTTACQSGDIVCVGDVGPAAEVCDGLDNNCDGVADNGNPGGGATCGATDVGECSYGTTACQSGGIVCVGNVGPAAEVCDGLDNDCDGVVDNGNPGGGATCGATDVGECSYGTTTCQEGGIVCVGDVGPAAEVCDGLDNDCDGVADDGNPGGGARCGTTDVGECGYGTTTCQAGTFACVGNVEPVAEVCDGRDNDCDGAVDEIRRVDAVCSVSPTNFNVTSEATQFKFSISSAVESCAGANPVAVNPATSTAAWVSRVGSYLLPDPATLQCPDPHNGLLGELGIFENLVNRQSTGSGVDLKFDSEADGNCQTRDGSRQEVFALLTDVLDGSTVPICFSSTIDGVAFECCASVKVTNSGSR